jgi:hypothetical protein
MVSTVLNPVSMVSVAFGAGAVFCARRTNAVAVIFAQSIAARLPFSSPAFVGKVSTAIRSASANFALANPTISSVFQKIVSSSQYPQYKVATPVTLVATVALYTLGAFACTKIARAAWNEMKTPGNGPISQTYSTLSAVGTAGVLVTGSSLLGIFRGVLGV